MVTGSDGDQNAQNGAGVGKTPVPKLMSLLPVSINVRIADLKVSFFRMCQPCLYLQPHNAATYKNKYTYSLPGY